MDNQKHEDLMAGCMSAILVQSIQIDVKSSPTRAVMCALTNRTWQSTTLLFQQSIELAEGRANCFQGPERAVELQECLFQV